MKKGLQGDISNVSFFVLRVFEPAYSLNMMLIVNVDCCDIRSCWHMWRMPQLFNGMNVKEIAGI